MPGRSRAADRLAWKFSGVLFYDFLRRAMQVTAAAVVSEAGPKLEHVVLAGGGQRIDSWEAREETVVVGDDGGDARLLQHHFRHPDAIGVAAGPPGERPPMMREPCQQRPLKILNPRGAAACESFRFKRSQAFVSCALHRFRHFRTEKRNGHPWECSGNVRECSGNFREWSS